LIVHMSRAILGIASDVISKTFMIFSPFLISECFRIIALIIRYQVVIFALVIPLVLKCKTHAEQMPSSVLPSNPALYQMSAFNLFLARTERECFSMSPQ